MAALQRDEMRVTGLLASALTACLLWTAGTSTVHASGIQLTDRCQRDDPGGVQLRAARETVARECSCSRATDHGTHWSCAAAVATRECELGNLPRSCRAAVRVCAAKTTCGRYGEKWVACCLNVR